MLKKGTFLLALMFILMTVALTPNNTYAATGSNSESVGTVVQGSMLSPGYVYVPGTAIVSPQPVALQLQSNNQPSFVDSVLYSGGDPTDQVQFLHPNYNNPTGIADQPLSNSLFPTSTANPATTAGFIRVGNVLPTSAESQALTNYTTIPNDYLGSYPWNDLYYSNENTTASASVTVNLTRYNTTMNLDQWSTFNINQNQSMVITFTLSTGLFNAYFAQLSGSINYALFNATGHVISSSSLSSGRNAYIDTFFMNQPTLGNGRVYMSLWSSSDSQVIVRISKVSFSPTTLSLNSPAQDKQDTTFGNLPISTDIFSEFATTHFKTFKFTVPSSLNNKFFSINFQYNADTLFAPLNSNVQVFSDQGRTASADGSAILGRTGETWFIVFNTYDGSAWNYYLVVQPTTVPNYILGTQQDYIFPQTVSTTNYLQLNISSSNLYRVYMESNQINSPYSGISTDVNFYNGNQSTYLSLSGSSSLNSLYYFKNGTYLVALSSTSSSNRVSVRFEIDPITPAVKTAQNALGLHDFMVVAFNNPYIGNTYNVSLKFLTNQSIAAYNLNIFNSFGTSVAFHAPVLSSNPGTNFTSYNITSSIWGPKLYAFVYPTVIFDSNATRDLTSLVLNMTIIEYHGISGLTINPSVNASPITPGFYTFLKSASYPSISLQVNLTNLPTKTWVRIEIKYYTANTTLTTSTFELIQVPTISTTNSLNTMSEYAVRTFTGGLITAFGFGSMNTTATMLLTLHRPSNTIGGNVTISVLPQLTQSLALGYPLPGPIAPSASSAPAVAGFGAAPGFLLIPVIGLLGFVVLVRKMRHNKKD